MSQVETAGIKEAIRHLTRRQWRVAVYVILFIVGSSAILRQVHVNAIAARSEVKNDSTTR